CDVQRPMGEAPPVGIGPYELRLGRRSGPLSRRRDHRARASKVRRADQEEGRGDAGQAHRWSRCPQTASASVTRPSQSHRGQPRPGLTSAGPTSTGLTSWRRSSRKSTELFWRISPRMFPSNNVTIQKLNENDSTTIYFDPAKPFYPLV